MLKWYLTFNTLVLTMSFLSYGAIEPIIIDLPELIGDYSFDLESPYGKSRFTVVDLGDLIPFEIGSVGLLIGGDYQSGVALWEGTEASRDNNYNGTFTSHIAHADHIMALGPLNFYPELDGNFEEEYPYLRMTDTGWDFQANIVLSFSIIMSSTMIIEQLPTACITNAELVIYPIPEPASLMLFSVGILFAKKRSHH